MNLEIHIETVDEDFDGIEISEENGLQMRHDGMLVDGKLHFWENILTVKIFNQEVTKKLKRKHRR